jgi:hypothetical protein
MCHAEYVEFNLVGGIFFRLSVWNGHVGQEVVNDLFLLARKNGVRRCQVDEAVIARDLIVAQELEPSRLVFSDPFKCVTAVTMDGVKEFSGLRIHIVVFVTRVRNATGEHIVAAAADIDIVTTEEAHTPFHERDLFRGIP